MDYAQRRCIPYRLPDGIPLAGCYRFGDEEEEEVEVYDHSVSGSRRSSDSCPTLLETPDFSSAVAESEKLGMGEGLRRNSARSRSLDCRCLETGDQKKKKKKCQQVDSTVRSSVLRFLKVVVAFRDRRTAAVRLYLKRPSAPLRFAVLDMS